MPKERYVIFQYLKYQQRVCHSYYISSIPYRMSTAPATELFSCSTCQAPFHAEDAYKEHYKSQFHRYNLKRKMINLPPISHSQYIEQFDSQQSKASTTADFRCEICSKGFSSPNTYSHHLNSKKHKNSRERMLSKSQNKSLQKSGSQSSSNFSIISRDQKNERSCLFCHCDLTEEHLKTHNFPPYRYNCTDYAGLVESVKSIINSFKCLYCHTQFSTIEAVKQHMAEVGHAKIDTEDFASFENFYDWAIQEEENEDDQQEEQNWEVIEEKQRPKQKMTLKELQARRRDRVILTRTGAMINGKLMGLRSYRRYYSQYFRPIHKIDRTPKALCSEEHCHVFAPVKFKAPVIACIRPRQ